MTADQPIHATCVSIGRDGLLIVGPSGSGKSSLALQLLTMGAVLVADDRVVLSNDDDMLWASCPGTLTGKIEARGVGILQSVSLTRAAIKVVVDMGQQELERIPPQRHIDLNGHRFPLLHRVDGIHFAPALVQFMRGGRDG